MQFAIKGNIAKYQTTERIEKIFYLLQDRYGKPDPPLFHNTVEELAIAVILSAQCTDARVNQVTPSLFAKFPNIEAFANASIKEIENAIYSTGFYRNKAKNIHELAHILIEKYHSKIPNDFNTLISLPGIGRKTANVIMNQAFNQSIGIVVDTHVSRITQRLGFTQKTSALTIEKDLMKVIPDNLWKEFPLLLIFLGREFCKSRKAICKECPLVMMCPSSILATEDHLS